MLLLNEKQIWKFPTYGYLLLIDYNEEISNRLISDEERKYGKIPTRIYTLYLKSCGLYIVSIFFLSAFGWQALRVYTDVWLKDWTDNKSSPEENDKNQVKTKIFLFLHKSIEAMSVSMYNPSKEDTKKNLSPKHKIINFFLIFFNVGRIFTTYFLFSQIFYYFKIYGILSSACILFTLISTPAGQLAGCRARRVIHNKLLDSILRNSLHFFQVTPVGRILNRFSNDMSVIDKVCSHFILCIMYFYGFIFYLVIKLNNHFSRSRQIFSNKNCNIFHAIKL